MPRFLPALSRLATLLFVLALPTLLITSNVRFLMSEVRVYEYSFRTYHADRVTGLPMADLDRAAREIIDYFENDESTLRIVVQENGNEASLFNARETEHMRDVKSLVRLLFRLNEISLAYVMTYMVGVFVWARAPLRRLALESLAGLAAGFAVVLAVGSLAVIGFDSMWRDFHEIAFRNDLWQLDPDTDHLIQMFPEPFWQDMTYLLGILTLAEATVILALSLGYLLAKRQLWPLRAKTDTRPQAPREIRPAEVGDRSNPVG